MSKANWRIHLEPFLIWVLTLLTLVFCKYLAQHAFVGKKFQAKVIPRYISYRLVPSRSSLGLMVILKRCVK